VTWYDFEPLPCDVCGKPVGYRRLAPKSEKSYCSLGCRELDRGVGPGNIITRRQFNELLDQQAGRCAICRRSLGPMDDQERPCLDHDHKTGLVRGILCTKCNFALGLLRDDPDTAEAAAAYLRRRVSALP